METWQTGPAEVQTAVLHCLALLSQQSISLPALAAVGAVPLAAEAAHSRSPTRQQRAAVLLANLCAERQTLQLVAESPEALEALVRLSQLPDRTVQVRDARRLQNDTMPYSAPWWQSCGRVCTACNLGRRFEQHATCPSMSAASGVPATMARLQHDGMVAKCNTNRA